VYCLEGSVNVALLLMRAEELNGHLDALLLAAPEAFMILGVLAADPAARRAAAVAMTASAARLGLSARLLRPAR
jgi:hypothetical protein